MNWKNLKRTLSVIKLFALVMIVSLAVLPLSSSHASSKVSTEASHGVHAIDLQLEDLSDSVSGDNDCLQHASKTNGNHEHGSESCCQAFCVAVSLVEYSSFSLPVLARPSFDIQLTSAVLPGEIVTPHRPPNA